MRKVVDIEKDIKKEISKDITCTQWHSSVLLEGVVDTWDEVVLAGKIAAKGGYKGVVNKLEVKNLNIPDMKKPLISDNILDKKRVDVLIIGGGITGASIARELSKWNVSILLVDKEEDLAIHASSRNDGMIHPGISPKPGSKRAKFNVKGNKMYSRIAKELDVPFRRIGSLILFDKKFMRLAMPFIKRRAKLNGIEGIEYLNRKKILELEPSITENITGGFYIPSTGVLSPYKMTIAYGENAVLNGVEISFNTLVKSMEKKHGKIISVKTNRGTICPKVVINAGGIYSDKIADMADDMFFTIHPRKGEIILIDKKKGELLDTVVAKPSIGSTKGNTKGGGIVKTIDDNLLIGPDAYEQPYREDYTTNRDNISNLMEKFLPLLPKLSSKDVITYMAGTRASTYEEDFIIEASEYVANLIHAAGIQSPGLASAPAISEEIEKITIEKLSKITNVKRKENWNPIRKGIPRLNDMDIGKRNKFIKNNPNYGEIVCRCEEISKGEIIEAIHAPIPAKTVDGIKKRVRPGMGRCQGGFCMPFITKIIEDELGTDMTKITKKGKGSELLVNKTKDNNIYESREVGGQEHERV
ncbi:FAD-dependent oxidoreductase [Dethiothermospora halolimnae]|uniref:FAD-dependent oxidoreductase n=1 Tax=Dethiothermospora halolimnae TaxID=3114390 RepID=UPI003CCC22F1